jgi:hypothetical protein
MHLLVALPSLAIPGKRWCRDNFICAYCHGRGRPIFRKRKIRKVVHFFEARVPIYWFQCGHCKRLSYIHPAGIDKGRQYSQAIRLLVALRHVLGFELPETQAFLSRWGIGAAWVKRCVADLRGEDAAFGSLHRRNRSRRSVFSIVGVLDRQYDVSPAAVTVIRTGYVLLSLRGDRQGRETLSWIVRFVRDQLAGTGTGVRLLRRKPFLSPLREVTFERMESTADALRLVLDQLGENSLHRP